MVTGHDIYDLLFANAGGPGERYTRRTVDAVGADGTPYVYMNQSTRMACERLCDVKKGDRVLVLITQHRAVIIGKVTT